MINLQNFNVDQIKSSIAKDGYYICKNLIDPTIIHDLKNFWIKYYKSINPKKLQKVQWKPYLGEPNKVGFSKDADQHLFRTFDFFWNPPINETNKNLVFELRKLSLNLANDKTPFGNQFSHDKFGIYSTSSYYPPGDGFLAEHSDSIIDNVLDNALIHHIVPITFLGEDYDSGGLFIIDHSKKIVNIDQLVTYGDVIFYNGNLPHGVKKIESSKNIGRIQTFAIPTNFLSPNKSKNIFNDLNVLEMFEHLIKLPLRKVKQFL